MFSHYELHWPERSASLRPAARGSVSMEQHGPTQCETSATRWQPRAAERRRASSAWFVWTMWDNSRLQLHQDSNLDQQILQQGCRKTAATTQSSQTKRVFMKEPRVWTWSRRWLDHVHTVDMAVVDYWSISHMWLQYNFMCEKSTQWFTFSLSRGERLWSGSELGELVTQPVQAKPFPSRELGLTSRRVTSCVCSGLTLSATGILQLLCDLVVSEWESRAAFQSIYTDHAFFET